MDDPELLVTNLSSPRSLICDDKDNVVYYWIDKDLWRYTMGAGDDPDETGRIAKDLGIYKNLFYYE
jgi:hypothetical protein